MLPLLISKQLGPQTWAESSREPGVVLVGCDLVSEVTTLGRSKRSSNDRQLIVHETPPVAHAKSTQGPNSGRAQADGRG